MDILDMISQDNYICYNKKLAKRIGINETIIFMYFVSQHKWFESNNKLTVDGYFYKTADDIYENTGLSRYQQKSAIDSLREYGLIDYSIKGVPATLHFKLFVDNLQRLFDPSFKESGKLVLKEVKTKVLTKGKPSIKESLKHTITNNILEIDNNKEQEKSSKEDRFLISEGINLLIQELKILCNELGVAYNKKDDRKFGKHIITAKDYGEFCESIGQNRITFAKNVLRASISINYWKGPCAGPMMIYQNYPEVYNLTKSNKKKIEEKRQSVGFLTPIGGKNEGN